MDQAPRLEDLSPTQLRKLPPLTTQLTGRSEIPLSKGNCGRCREPLFNIKGGGRIVTLPKSTSDGMKDVETGENESFHVDCFKCDACDGSFQEKDGIAAFVRFEGGARHLEVRNSSFHKQIILTRCSLLHVVVYPEQSH